MATVAELRPARFALHSNAQHTLTILGRPSALRPVVARVQRHDVDGAGVFGAPVVSRVHIGLCVEEPMFNDDFAMVRKLMVHDLIT